RNIGDDRSQAIHLLRQLMADESSGEWANSHVLLVQWAVENKTQTEAYESICASKLCKLRPLVFHTLCGWLSASLGKTEAAKLDLNRAVQALTDEAHCDHLFLLAQALLSVGEDEQALPLLLRCYHPGMFDVECRKLLDCARRLNRHEVSARVCR